MRRSWFVYACAVLTFVLLLLGARSAQATWSVVLADSVTGEVAIGSVTCLGGDLLGNTPVILVWIGGGVAQAGSDPDGSRRQVIRTELLNGTHPQQIIDQFLAGIGGHNHRQYGIVDTKGGTATFTGKPREWAGGVTGQSGSTVYAIQGNVLAGSCVVPAMVDAVTDPSNGDIPEKLMAAMEAARVNGGDGRCSCGNNRTSCGCPPPDFTKSGHIGYMLVARRGDIDDPVCDLDGCADGDYFMKFNVATIEASDPDPVITLQQMFNAWDEGLEGRPDAVQSMIVSITSAGAGFEMLIQLKDRHQTDIPTGVAMVTVDHDDGSAGISSIGEPLEIGNGLFSVTLTPGGSTGTDRFLITADDGLGPRPVILTPSPELSVGGGTDADGDGYAAPGPDCDDSDASVNPDATEDCTDGIDNDCDGLTDSFDFDCTACKQKNEACSSNTECCSGKCRKGKCAGGNVSGSSTLTPWDKTDLTQLAAGNFCPLFPSFYSVSFPKGTSRPTMKDAIAADGGIALPSARQ